MMTYPNLIFDLYGTLVDIHTEESPQVWEKTALFFSYHGVPYTGPSLRAAFQQELKAREAKAGQSYECYPDVPCEAIFSKLFGNAENAQALSVQAAQLFRICSTEYIRLYPHVRSALETLRQRGHRLWLLSNAQAVFTRRELVALGLENVFDGVFLSSDYGCRKPDPRFYRGLLDGQHLAPETCLMIGNDRDTDIAGAQALGIPTLYLHTNLTPADQSPAQGPREVEGADWAALPDIISSLH